MVPFVALLGPHPTFGCPDVWRPQIWSVSLTSAESFDFCLTCGVARHKAIDEHID
jgi:hypothetical protein